jgi:hypothetical protein
LAWVYVAQRKFWASIAPQRHPVSIGVVSMRNF